MGRVAISHIIDRVDNQTITIINTGTTSHFHFQKQGILKGISYTLNNNTNNVTTVFTIKDDEGTTLYTSAALNENTSGYINPDIRLYNADHTFIATSADPGASGNIITVTLLVER
jgi:hypothetical protein